MFNPLEDFISLIFPNTCIACRKDLYVGEMYICFSCLNDLPYSHYEKQRENPVERSFYGRIEIYEAMSFLLFEKGSKTQKIMFHLKYKNMPELGVFFGKMMGEAIRSSNRFKAVEAVIPVPLHPSKMRIRKYNQSEEIGKGIADILKVPLLSNAIKRIERTETQTRKRRYERWENVKSVFKSESKDLSRLNHILLVDDVITTGATLEACASSINEIGSLNVSVATLAYSD